MAETIRLKTLTRLATIESTRVGEDEDDRRVALAFSSEEPIERWFGTEILGHDEGEADLGFIAGGRAPLLVDHDPSDVIGVVEQAEIGSDRVGRATVRFGKSARAEEILADVRDGIRLNISVGYRINRLREEEEKDVVRAISWSPLEVSIVSVPADQSVGVGRADDEEHDAIIERRASDTPKHTEVETMTDTTTPVVDEAAIKRASTDATTSERARVADIQALAKRHDMDGAKAIEEGVTVEQFRGMILDKYGDSRQMETPVADVGLSDKEKQGYSLLRAVNTIVRNKLQGRNDSCFELEVSQEIGQKLGREAQGFFLPTGLNFARDLTVGTDSEGGYLKGTDHMGSEFIDVLRNRLVTKAMGARVLSGLRGDIDIPTRSAGATSYWVGENSAPTEGANTWGQKTASPKTVAAYVDLSRRLMQQSDPSVEALVRSDLVASLATKVDDSALEGGATNAPTGVLETSGIGAYSGLGTNGGEPTWAMLVEMWKAIAVDNADIASMAWVTTPGVIAKLMQTVKVSSTDSRMLLENITDNLLGFPVHYTNQMPSDLDKGSTSGTLHAMLFGNWSDLVICEWSNIDISVDPYTLSTQGATRLTAFYDVDCVVRRAESFSECNEIVV